ncbi:unnamed protein product [Lactuca virosa]|uniref:Uncharacterized protein n=1 Tax=Lactuca virosa TaxID=75947 RepID=A0AAU9PLR0_9ASTR|nr:unnamed protein product [Lactuca virosa]
MLQSLHLSKINITKPFFHLTLNISSSLLLPSSDNIHNLRRPYHRRLCSGDLPLSSPVSTAPPPPPSPLLTSATTINHPPPYPILGEYPYLHQILLDPHQKSPDLHQI